MKKLKMNVSKLMILFLFFLITTNCKKNTSLDKETSEIIKTILNESYKAYFRKPLSYKKNESKILVNKKTLFLIDPEMKPFSKEISIKKDYIDYKEVLDQLLLIKNSKLIDLDKILLNDYIVISELNKKALKNNQFNLIISFSRISFKKNKAALAVSISENSLVGYYDLFFLEKKNNTWKIVGTQSISIS